MGMLLTALHTAGLATLTHTPSPMGFLGEILGRPKHERPYLLIPVGYPAQTPGSPTSIGRRSPRCARSCDAAGPRSAGPTR